MAEHSSSKDETWGTDTTSAAREEFNFFHEKKEHATCVQVLQLMIINFDQSSPMARLSSRVLQVTASSPQTQGCSIRVLLTSSRGTKVLTGLRNYTEN